jgi:hypothetical protein
MDMPACFKLFVEPSPNLVSQIAWDRSGSAWGDRKGRRRLRGANHRGNRWGLGESAYRERKPAGTADKEGFHNLFFEDEMKSGSLMDSRIWILALVRAIKRLRRGNCTTLLFSLKMRV